MHGLQVDCSSLPEGLHFAEISASDSTAPWRGALFRLPVTVIKPARAGDSSPSGPSGAASAGSPGKAHACSHMPFSRGNPCIELSAL